MLPVYCSTRPLLAIKQDQGLDTASAARLHALRARLYELQQKPLDALHERLLESTLIQGSPTPEAEQRELNEAIWRQLAQLRDEDFSVLEYADTSNKAEEQLLAGWVALARIQRMHPGELDKQSAALKDWERSYPVHPCEPLHAGGHGDAEASAGRVAAAVLRCCCR
jgi:outer membrane PBP1 activator LpoA protein